LTINHLYFCISWVFFLHALPNLLLPPLPVRTTPRMTSSHHLSFRSSIQQVIYSSSRIESVSLSFLQFIICMKTLNFRSIIDCLKIIPTLFQNKSKSRFTETQYNHHCDRWLPPSTWTSLCTLVNIGTLLSEISSTNNLSVFLKYFPSTLKSNRSPRAI